MLLAAGACTHAAVRTHAAKNLVSSSPPHTVQHTTWVPEVLAYKGARHNLLQKQPISQAPLLHCQANLSLFLPYNNPGSHAPLLYLAGSSLPGAAAASLTAGRYLLHLSHKGGCAEAAAAAAAKLPPLSYMLTAVR